MDLLHYGLQRSGTNYIEMVLRKNYRVRFINSNEDRRSPIQKHCRFYTDKTIITDPQYRNDITVNNIEEFEALFKTVPKFYIIISKDPYSWFLSYRQWGQKCGWQPPSHHYIQEYNLFYGFFINLALQSDKFIFIRYIDLITHERKVLSTMEKQMMLERKAIAYLKLRMPNKVDQSDTFTDKKRAYYINQKYLDSFEPGEISLLNQHLDPCVSTGLGYTVYNPAS